MITVRTDYKKIRPGDTYVALRGITTDGHDYITEAIARGAKKIVAEEGAYPVKYEIVSDTRRYINRYLEENYNEVLKKITIVGVTGTNGKSTVVHLLRTSLLQLGKNAASIGTLGFFINHQKIEDLEDVHPDICDIYGFILEAIDAGCEYIAIEASSLSLVDGSFETLLFNHAIFTNLTQDHLDYHLTMEKYVMAKRILFQKLVPNGIAIVNTDDLYGNNFLFYDNHNITFGKGKCDFKILKNQQSWEESIFTFQYRDDIYQVNTKIVGDFNIYNLMPVIIFLLCIGIPPVKMLKTVYLLTLPAGRFEQIPFRTNKIIIDYAHTPAAIEQVLKTGKTLTKGKLYVVFGCHGEKDRGKRPIMTKLVSQYATYFIITSDDVGREDPGQIINDMLYNKDFTNYEICLERKKAILKGMMLLKDQDVLFVLGKGQEEVLKLKEGKIPFNDRKVVLDLLSHYTKR